MGKLQIEWGKLDRSESLENLIFEKSDKIFTLYPKATGLVINFQITNPKTSGGPSMQKVSMELRLPHHQDIHLHKEGKDVQVLVNECFKVLVSKKS